MNNDASINLFLSHFGVFLFGVIVGFLFRGSDTFYGDDDDDTPKMAG